MTTTIRNEQTGVPCTASCHTTRPAAEHVALEESINLAARPIDNKQITITRREPADPLGPPLRNHDNSFASEADDLEEAGWPATGGEHSSSGEPSVRSKRPKMCMAVIIAGLLSLIAVPGLVLGIVRKEIPAGIALSGAIATVVSFLAGLYYFHHK